MQTVRRTPRMARWWIPLVVVGVMTASGVVIGALRVRDIPDRAIGHSPAPAAQATPRTKLVEYTVDGDAGGRADVSYLSAAGGVVTVQVGLPWSLRTQSNQLTTAAGIVAQSDGDHLTCGIAINGQQRDRREANAESAAVTCAVPAA